MATSCINMRCNLRFKANVRSSEVFAAICARLHRAPNPTAPMMGSGVKVAFSELGFDVRYAVITYDPVLESLELVDDTVHPWWDEMFLVLAPFLVEGSNFGVLDSSGNLFGWKVIDGRARVQNGRVVWSTSLNYTVELTAKDTETLKRRRRVGGAEAWWYGNGHPNIPPSLHATFGEALASRPDWAAGGRITELGMEGWMCQVVVNQYVLTLPFDDLTETGEIAEYALSHRGIGLPNPEGGEGLSRGEDAAPQQ